jgi:hypothetical protein
VTSLIAELFGMKLSIVQLFNQNALKIPINSINSISSVDSDQSIQDELIFLIVLLVDNSANMSTIVSYPMEDS